MNTKTKKGLISLLWRLGAVLVIALVDFTAANLGLFDLPVEVVGISGILLGEISKQLRGIWTTKE